MNWNGIELPDQNIYFQDDAVVIYHADCREILPLISNKSIDLVLTSPPYDNLRDYGAIKSNTTWGFESTAHGLNKILCDGGVIVWIYEIGKFKVTKDEIAYDHPSIFSEELATDHILSWSNKGDIILDPFLGSGTVTKQAKKLNRKCIGIEIEEKYCEIAAKRCSQSVMALEMK